MRPALRTIGMAGRGVALVALIAAALAVPVVVPVAVAVAVCRVAVRLAFVGVLGGRVAVVRLDGMHVLFFVPVCGLAVVLAFALVNGGNRMLRPRMNLVAVAAAVGGAGAAMVLVL